MAETEKYASWSPQTSPHLDGCLGFPTWGGKWNRLFPGICIGGRETPLPGGAKKQLQEITNLGGPAIPGISACRTTDG